MTAASFSFKLAKPSSSLPFIANPNIQAISRIPISILEKVLFASGIELRLM
jgi:hypothetical protein